MADRRPSPAHPGVPPPNPVGGGQPMQQQHSQQPQPPRRVNMTEFNDRANLIRQTIAQQEAALQHFTAQRGNAADPNYMNKIRALAAEIKQKKDYLAKMSAAVQAVTAQNMAQAAAQHQQGSGGAGTGQASWMPQANPPQTFDNAGNVQMPRGPGLNQQQQGQNNIQPSPSHLHTQIQQANHLMSQGIVPPRSGPTPQQQPHPTPGVGGTPNAGSYSNQMSPNMGQQFALPMNNAGGSISSPASIGASGGHPSPSLSGPLPPPLDKATFESTYKNFCASKGVKHEMRLLSVEGRNIDLHALHTQVMQEGGLSKVHGKELWSIIGGRMGFVNFPATDAEPAKSGPGVAQRLAQVYQEYVYPFDQVYLNSVTNSRIKLQAAAVQAQGSASGAGSGSGGPSQPQQAARGMLSPQQMQLVIGYANQSVAELRAQNVQENIIKFVEQNRAHLQRTVMEQGMFRGQLHNQGLRPSEQQPQPQQRGIPSVQGPFPGASAQPGVAAPSAGQRPPFMQQNGGLPMQGNNFMNNRPQQQLGGPGPGPRFTQEQIKSFIEKTVNDFRNHTLPNMRPVDIPVEQRQQFNSLFQQLHQVVTEIHSKLPMYFFVAKSEEWIRKLIAIITTVQQQHSLLSNGGPYIVTFELLKNMMLQVQQSNELANNYLSKAYNRPQQLPQSQQQPHHHQSPPGGMPPSHPPQDMTRPSIPHLPQQQQQQQQPQVPHPPNRPPVNLRPPSIMKKPSVSTPNTSATAAISTPTPPPAYSASTPVASAPTPTQTASSPQAPKSPKGKAPAKPKAPPKSRRASVKNQNPPAPPPPPPEQPQTPASSSGGNTKRQREEEIPAANAFGASPVASGSGAASEPSPPKRIKTEWEGPPSEALKKKTDAVENIKTEEDASAFLEQMTELIKMAAGGEGQESLTTDISETLDMILKGYGTVPDGSEGAHNLSSLGLGESSRTSPPPTKPPADEFVEFFDFSSFDPLEDDDDDGSKAPTPELIPSSSTNPSPESNSEADPHHALLSSTETKTEDFPDLLRLGTLKEIDGGESAYYQPGDWKWDSPMPTLEQPWAIFTS
ncbi:hypothetical protein Hypma_000130 [Hypsizygus marmoreus]|uniref:ARID domain-containing protein n=1 Tax=Hypsizygus marmoreus TaxID=39966 RepID=A0A369KBZ0_HYPMA|nr:hypothetical protein Hypma_000130 [Hypsizygus marmoreus]